jgi:hypothetical protein
MVLEKKEDFKIWNEKSKGNPFLDLYHWYEGEEAGICNWNGPFNYAK